MGKMGSKGNTLWLSNQGFYSTVSLDLSFNPDILNICIM